MAVAAVRNKSSIAQVQTAHVILAATPSPHRLLAKVVVASANRTFVVARATADRVRAAAPRHVRAAVSGTNVAL